MIRFLVIFTIVITHSCLILSQNVSDFYFRYHSNKILYDLGKNWNSLTNYTPLTYDQTIYSNKDTKVSFYINGQNFFNKSINERLIQGFIFLPFKNNFYMYLQPLLKNTITKNDTIDIKNNYFEIYQSGIGYKNSWIKMQIARSKESWGSGNDIQLALSEKSQPYDYFLLASDYGSLRVHYIHGALDVFQNNVNRYITARGLEWSNKESFILGLSETVIYSGPNRSIDYGYFNPVSSHLEVELNNRLKIIGDGSSNAVWQVHMDYLFKKNIRLSLNYLYDEFVIDPNIEIGKEHGRAYSLRLAFKPFFKNKELLTLYSSYTYVGTPTFRHGTGTNNFVHNGKPLGWSKGSDGRDLCLGSNYLINRRFKASISLGFFQSGNESILNRIFEPYIDYQKGSFPSGTVKNTYYLTSKVYNSLKNDILIFGEIYTSKDLTKIKIGLSAPLFQKTNE